jgi:hypothetical protein
MSEFFSGETLFEDFNDRAMSVTRARRFRADARQESRLEA